MEFLTVEASCSAFCQGRNLSRLIDFLEFIEIFTGHIKYVNASEVKGCSKQDEKSSWWILSIFVLWVIMFGALSLLFSIT